MFAALQDLFIYSLNVFLLLLQFPTLPRLTLNKTLRPEMNQLLVQSKRGRDKYQKQQGEEGFPPLRKIIHIP